MTHGNELKILLVEDNPGDALLIKEALKESIYRNATLILADCLAEAKRLSQENVVLLLLDLGLPDSNGLETITQMRNYFPESAIVILTGLDDDEVASEAFQQGAQSYIHKNEINGKVLSRTIRFSLERHEFIQRLKATEKRLVDAQAVAKVGSWETDLSTLKVIWSLETYRIFELDPSQFQPMHTTFLDYVHPEDRFFVDEAFKASFHSNKYHSIIHRLVTKSGNQKWIEEKWSVYKDDNDNPIKAFGTCQDITESKKLEEQQAMFALIVNSSEDAIISKNLEGIITSWNHGAEKQFGYSLNEITGKHISIIIPANLQNEEKEIFERIRSGNSVDQYETERIRKDGKIIQVSLTISPIRDLMGNIIGVSKISRDITEKKKLEDLLDKANRLAKIGNWEADLIKGTVYWSAVTKEIHETETGYVPDLSQGVSFYKEGKNRDRITRCVQTCIEQGTAWEEELQIVTAKGNLKWIKTIGNAEFKEGKCIRFYGSFQDIDERKKAEEELRQSELKFRRIFDSKMVGIIFWDENGDISESNDRFLEIVGYTWQDLKEGKLHWNQMTPAEYTELDQWGLKQIELTGVCPPIEKEYFRKDGSRVSILIGAATLDKDSTAKGVAYITDITERKKAERKLRESEEFNRTILESSPDCLKVMDNEGRLVFMNKNGCDLMEVDDFNSLKNKYWWNVWGEENKQIVKASVKKSLEGEPAHFEAFCATAKGTAKWWSVIVSPVAKTADGIEQIVSVSRDITKTKKLEDLLDKTNRLAKIGNWEADLIKGTVYWSAVTKEIHETETGYVPDLSQGLSFYKEGKSRDRITHCVQACIEQGTAWEEELQIVTAKGNIKWIKTIGNAEFKEGKCLRFYGSFQDIDERKEAEEEIFKLNAELSKSEKRFKGLVENSNDIIRLSDENFKPIYRSPNLERITGWSNEELEKQGDVMPAHPEDRERMAAFLKEIKSNPEKIIPFHYRFKHKEGHYIWAEGSSVNMLHDESIKGIISTFRDVTKQKQAEEKLRQSEILYRTIASSIPGSGICLIDESYRYFLVEGDLLEKLGYSRENLLGNTIKDVLPPEVYADLLPDFERAYRGEICNRESDNGIYSTISRFVPLKDEHNKVYAVMVVVLDVTELKKAERTIAELNVGLEEKIKKRTEQLDNVNKELESFTYSVSHDLRAPLRAINGYARMLEEDYTSLFDDNGKRLLNIVQHNAAKMGQLIDDLLAFSRLGRKEIQKSQVDMTALAEEVLKEVIFVRADTEVKLYPLHSIWGDSILLKQVLVNYISNAVKYSSKTEKPFIEINSTLSGNKVIYSVSDNGSGFDMAYVDKLFRVFQRLHSNEEFEGTGVGLAIVDRIVKKHEGEVWAEGKVGKGATFYFILPAKSEVTENIQTSNL